MRGFRVEETLRAIMPIQALDRMQIWYLAASARLDPEDAGGVHQASV
jgi:hypothetical protein